MPFSFVGRVTSTYAIALATRGKPQAQQVAELAESIALFVRTMGHENVKDDVVAEAATGYLLALIADAIKPPREPWEVDDG